MKKCKKDLCKIADTAVCKRAGRSKAQPNEPAGDKVWHKRHVDKQNKKEQKENT